MRQLPLNMHLHFHFSIYPIFSKKAYAIPLRPYYSSFLIGRIIKFALDKTKCMLQLEGDPVVWASSLGQVRLKTYLQITVPSWYLNRHAMCKPPRIWVVQHSVRWYVCVTTARNMIPPLHSTQLYRGPHSQKTASLIFFRN